MVAARALHRATRDPLWRTGSAANNAVERAFAVGHDLRSTEVGAAVERRSNSIPRIDRHRDDIHLSRMEKKL
jgi:hypothetical protein